LKTSNSRLARSANESFWFGAAKRSSCSLICTNDTVLRRFGAQAVSSATPGKSPLARIPNL
jgi:hypothetical protein